MLKKIQKDPESIGIPGLYRGGGEMKNTLCIYQLIYIANRVNSNVT